MSKITYVVGDIHGCYSHLQQMYEKILRDVVANNYEGWEVVFIGDYIDRGPDSKKVLDFLMALDPENTIFLMGNHEDMFLHNTRGFLMNGGYETLRSFELSIADTIPQKYVDWITNLRISYETDDYFFVHAGVYPGISLENQGREDMIWIRGEFLNSDYDWGKRIIHGHTPVKDVTVKPNRINIDTGAVYQGLLSCVVLEKDKEPRFLQVKEGDGI